MTMTSSFLTCYKDISKNNYGLRNHNIDTITIHHMAGNLTIEQCGKVFKNKRACSNYGIGSDGRIACYCYEEYAAMTSSNKSNDERAITIEVANDSLGPEWHVSSEAITSLISLCYDICIRYNIKELIFKNDKHLVGNPYLQNVTIHSFFSATLCPGPYLLSKIPYVCEKVNNMLKCTVKDNNNNLENNDVLYKVQLGAFKNKEGAEKLKSELEKLGYSCIIKKERQ